MLTIYNFVNNITINTDRFKRYNRENRKFLMVDQARISISEISMDKKDTNAI